MYVSHKLCNQHCAHNAENFLAPQKLPFGPLRQPSPQLPVPVAQWSPPCRPVLPLRKPPGSEVPRHGVFALVSSPTHTRTYTHVHTQDRAVSISDFVSYTHPCPAPHPLCGCPTVCSPAGSHFGATGSTAAVRTHPVFTCRCAPLSSGKYLGVGRFPHALAVCLTS